MIKIKQTKRRVLWKFLLLFFLCFFTVARQGFSELKVKGDLTPQDIYQNFEKYTPEDIMNKTQKAIDFFLDLGEEEALKEFDSSPPSQWAPSLLEGGFVVLMCDEFRAVAHPLSVYFSVFKEKDFAFLFKDVNGKRVYFRLCKKGEYFLQGAWVNQENFWPYAKGPVSIGMFIKQIPGTPFQMHTYYPNSKFSEEELDKLTQQWIKKK